MKWTDPDGREHTGTEKVAPGTAVGTHVTVWTDRDGDRVPRPLSPAESVFGGVTADVWAAVAAGAVAWADTRALHAYVGRRRTAEWDTDWARADAR